MIRRPPRSTRTAPLVPDTTLFRSVPGGAVRAGPKSRFRNRRALSDRRNLQSVHPFARLSRLLDGYPAGDAAPLLLSIGEPKNQPPAFVAEAIAGAAASWSSYPPRSEERRVGKECVSTCSSRRAAD